MTFKVMAWAAAFFLGFGVLLITAKSDFLQFNPSDIVAQINAPEEVREWLWRLLPSQASMEVVRQKAVTINLHRVLIFVVSATWPFAILGGILWWFYWPRLWQMREFYADAGVAHTQKGILPIRAAFFGTHKPSLRKFRESEFSVSPATRGFRARPIPSDKAEPEPSFIPASQTTAQRKQDNNLWERLREWRRTRWDAILEWWQLLGDRVTESWQSEKHLGNKVFAVWHTLTEPPTEYHPDALLRITAVTNPNRVFPSWKSTAVLVGSLILMLEILTMTPLTILLAAQWPLHFPTLAALVMISLNYLIPAIVQGRSIVKEMLKIVGVVVGLKLAVTLLAIGYLSAQLLWAPEQLNQMLEDAVAVTARFAGNSDDLGFDDLNAFVMTTSVINLAQVFILFVVLPGGLAGVTLLLRHLFTWYGFPQAKQRLMTVAYGVIGLTCLFLALTLLPLLTTTLQAITNTLREPDEFNKALILEVWGLIITGVGLGFFLRADRRYTNRCPECRAVIERPYELGKRCQTCQSPLHSWLIAEYDT